MFKKFSSVFYVAIVAALFLAGCGYKGAPVYKENNKTIDYNVTQSSDSSSRM
ncbi:MAG TPA: lipoprotein [Campylobacterales bacterium]|nr:lipoprotein [Campylobacterales bacterium]